MDTISTTEYHDFLARVFAVTSEPQEKLVLCGPKFYGMVSGCYNPKYWPKLRGSAHQRRIKRRYLMRMWNATKDSPYITEPPSRTLGSF